MYKQPKANRCCCLLFKCYLFSVSIFTFCLVLYHAWPNVNYWLPNLRLETDIRQ